MTLKTAARGLTLARVAHTVYVAARALADDAGLVRDRAELARNVGLSERRLCFWLKYLEGRRWKGRALALRRSVDELWVLLADIPGVPAAAAQTRTEKATLQRRWVTDRHGRQRLRKTADVMHAGAARDAEFRSLRARVGGYEAASTRHKAKAKADAVTIASLQAQLADNASSAAMAAMEADLKHAADCGDADCTRCLRITDVLEDDDGPYATAKEVAAKLERCVLLERVGEVLTEAYRTRSNEGVALAAAALELGLAGDMRGAYDALACIERARSRFIERKRGQLERDLWAMQAPTRT